MSESAGCFLLGKRKIENIFGETKEYVAEIKIDKRSESSIQCIVGFYDGSNASPLSFSMSIYPYSVKTIKGIEQYGRYKLLKSFIKNREEIIDLYFEAIRLFRFKASLWRNACLYSSTVVYNNSSYGRTGYSYLKVILPLGSRSRRINFTSSEFDSFIEMDDLFKIKTQFDRDELIEKNWTLRNKGKEGGSKTKKGGILMGL